MVLSILVVVIVHVLLLIVVLLWIGVVLTIVLVIVHIVPTLIVIALIVVLLLLVVVVSWLEVLLRSRHILFELVVSTTGRLEIICLVLPLGIGIHLELHGICLHLHIVS